MAPVVEPITARLHQHLSQQNPTPDKKVDTNSSNLHRDFLKLLETAANSDVTFIVQERRIKAHKGVLSVRCDYFQRMFDSDVQESVTNEVKVPDFEPDVFQSMLHYLYTDTLPENFAEVSFGLLVASDKYGIEALKQKCESDAPLNADNVVEALNVAEKIGSDILMDRAKKVFKLNFNDLMQSPETAEKLSKSMLMKLLSYFYNEHTVNVSDLSRK